MAAAAAQAPHTRLREAAVLLREHRAAAAVVPDPLQVQDQEAEATKIFLWHRLNG